MGSEEKQPSVRGGCGSRVLWENPAQSWRSFSQRRDCWVASVDDHGGHTHGAPRDGFERLGCHWLGQGQWSTELRRWSRWQEMISKGFPQGSIAPGMEDVMELVLKISQQSMVVSLLGMGSGATGMEHGGSPGPCVDGGLEASRRACKALEHCLTHCKCSVSVQGCSYCFHPKWTQGCSYAKSPALPGPTAPYSLLSAIPSPFHLDSSFLPFRLWLGHYCL